jgi:dienelactone hydrolase
MSGTARVHRARGSTRAVLTGLLTAAGLVAPAVAGAAVSPPPTTGPAPVGYLRTDLTDRHRTDPITPASGPRRLVLRIFYPAAAPGPAPASVLDDAERPAFAAAAGVPPDALAGLGGPATTGARPAPGRHPVLLLSHGLGSSTALLTADATDLASHGYVVVGIEHPGDALPVDVGAGRIVAPDPRGLKIVNLVFRTRVADVRFVLGRLATLRGAGRLDLSRVGGFGHSLGGAAMAGAMLAERRIRAGVDLDGRLFGPVIRRGLNRPFGIAVGDEPPLPTITAFRRNTAGPHPLRKESRTGHQAFTDVVWLAPQLGLDAPTRARLGLGTVDATTAVARQRTWLLQFFDRYLHR